MGAKRQKVSQQRIAQDLGVSQALVSLTLNGRREGIHVDTYRRIWEHALALGYQPKGMRFEQSPSEVRQRQIGILLRAGLAIHNQGTYFSHVLHGLHRALADRGYATVLIGSEDDLDTGKLQSFFTPSQALRGVVLLGEVAPAFLADLRRFERRIVAVSARHPGQCHSVIGNEAQSLELLVDHLTSLGHRRFGWLGGNIALNRHQMRYDAFRESLKARGIPFDERYAVRLVRGDRAEGAEAMLSLLPLGSRADFPTAFIAYNTLMAAGALRTLARERRHVPAEFSIAGADSSRLALEESPRITVAGSDAERLGSAAAGIVLEATGDQDESFNDLILPSQLTVGETTGPAPA